MEAYKAYIPVDRRHALEQGETLPEITHGTALFTDISGFTALTEALVNALGPQRGAEELSKHLKNIFSALTTEIMQFHGSIVSSGGDALLTWFEGDEKESAHQAVTTASAMRNAISPFSQISLPDGNTAQILIKSVIVNGSAHRYLVGDPNLQVFEMMAGSTLEKLDQIENYTEKDEISLYSGTAAILDGIISIKEHKTINQDLTYTILEELLEPALAKPWKNLPTKLTDEKASAWVLPAIHEHLRSGQEIFMADLRPAVALFMHFSGIEFDNDPDAGKEIDSFIRWVQKQVQRLDGSIINITSGDKGNFIYIVFGAPLAHEDDAARAVTLALQLLSAPQNFDFIPSIQIGITRGQVWTGPLGGDDWRTYAVIGNEVNLAARFMEAAQSGEMLASQRIVQETSNLFEWDMTAEINVKGRKKPISVYHVSDQTKKANAKSTSPSNRIIGRESERSLLLASLRSINKNETKIAIINGEAGIGKSRLVQDLLESALAENIPLLSGAGNAIEQSTSYYAWRAVFAKLFNVEQQNDSDQIRSKTRDWLQTHYRSLIDRAPLLDSVFGLDPQDNRLTEQMTGQVRADNTRDLLIKILRLYINKEPKILVLEDAHWLDSSSWSLLTDLAQNLTMLMIVISMREFTEDAPSQYTLLANLPGAIEIKLEQMQKNDISALVCQRLGVDSLPKPVETLIIHKAEGSPFFSEELAYALRDSGLIEIKNGECKIANGADLRELNFPDTVQGIITSRIDRLPPSQQLALKAASVVGRIFALQAVFQIYPLVSEKTQLGVYFEALRRLDITPLNSPNPELTYLFKHLITQEVAYGLLPFSQRQVFHQAAAEWYEQAFHDDLAPHYATLAYHWNNANQPDKSVEYLEKAGEQAMQNFSNREAVGYFEEAVSIVEQGKAKVSRLRQSHWERQIAEAYYSLSELTKSLNHLKQAIKLIGWETPEAGAGLITALLSEVFKQIQFRMRPKSITEAQLPSFQDDTQQARLLEGALAYVRLGQIYYQMNQPVLLIFGTMHGINLAEKAGLKSPILVRCYTNMCIATGVLPRHDWAISYRNRAHAMGRDVGDLPSLSYSLAGCGVYEIGSALWDDTEKDFTEAIEIDSRLGDIRHLDESKSLLSIARFHQGDFKHGLETAAEVLENATKRQDPIPQVWSHSLRAEIHLRQSKPDSFEIAITEYEKALKLLEKNIDQASTIRAEGALALTYWRKGNSLQALDLAAATAKKTVGTPTAPYAIEGYAGAAEVFLNAWENGELKHRANAQKACKALKKFAGVFPLAVARANLLQGRLDWLNGKTDRARTSWETVAKEAEKSRLPYEHGRALLYLGQYILQGEEQAKVLTRSLEIFNSLEVQYEADLIRKLTH